MKILKILQIGDIHYPDRLGQLSGIDIKDDALDAALVDKIDAPALQICMRKVVRMMQKEEFSFVLFMGDLTSRGNKDGYVECVEYLAANVLTIPNFNFDNIMFVAGNHDVNREEAISLGIEEKFDYITQALTKAGFKGISVESLDHRTVSSSESCIHVYGINSCIGCGEKRFLPKRLASLIQETISAAISDGDPQAQYDYYEQLDAPAFAQQTIEHLEDAIEQSKFTCLDIVVAHHNLLPQAGPRVDAYTELMNSGAMRTSLVSLRKPILYLHGHIHTDPIEILTDPIRASKPLVCVSAPAFESGFNIIEIGFNETPQPIGCRIRPFRLNKSRTVSEGIATVIPLSNGYNRLLQSFEREVASVVLKNQTLYWIDLVKKLKEKGLSISEDEIEECTRQLYWYGMINIEDLETTRSNWQIRGLMG